MQLIILACMASGRILSSMLLQRGGKLLMCPAGTETTSPGSYLLSTGRHLAVQKRSNVVRIHVVSFAFSAEDPTVPSRGSKRVRT